MRRDAIKQSIADLRAEMAETEDPGLIDDYRARIAALERERDDDARAWMAVARYSSRRYWESPLT